MFRSQRNEEFGNQVWKGGAYQPVEIAAIRGVIARRSLIKSTVKEDEKRKQPVLGTG